ncbi:ABC transporter ATP-binding protein [Streptomyces orinoci]|uniref:ATP-binding cassette domain-containing protein n=1 Tax=Streptomyces orinoci TaxID=67339 RepID=UPI00137A9106|nr:ABC transporter ATP-binding protein [Streptomyces orinoci]
MDPGRCIALVGANGSGKSTLLRAPAGRQTADEGRGLFDGAPVREQDPGFRRDVAVAMDGGERFPDLTVAEHIRMVAAAHGLGRRAAGAAATVLNHLELAARHGAFPDTLSAGQRQALLLSAALVRPARLLLLDEPEQRLDARARERLAEVLRETKRAGTGIVLVSHERALVETVADQVMLLASGRCAAQGGPAAVLGEEAAPWR